MKTKEENGILKNMQRKKREVEEYIEREWEGKEAQRFG